MYFVSQTVNKYNGNSVSCFRYKIKMFWLEKNDTHFIYTHSPSSSKKDTCIGVKLVTILIMASPIDMRNVIFICMFNVVWSQIPLPTKVISTNFSSPSQAIDKVAVFVVLKNTVFSVVPLVNSHWTSNALHYHLPQGTNNMSIPSLCIVLVKMILENITAISAKKNKTQSIGFTIMKIAIILLISNVFLGNTLIAVLEVFTNFPSTHTTLL